MQLGMVGLGRMGGNMVRRLMAGGHQCVVFDNNPETIKQFALLGATGSDSLAALVTQLSAPRAVWVMVPAGPITETVVADLGNLLERGDMLIDGGNSFFKDDIRRSEMLAQSGIHYLDVGTSGGVWGADRGYCLMIGGPESAAKHLDPIFRTLAPGRSGIEPSKERAGRAGTAEEGYLYCGPSGAGHFVKMIHNGIEYGLMQAYAEGFDIMKCAAQESLPASQRYNLNLADIAELWRRGSVVSSWLLDLTAMALAENADLSNFTGTVADSGEGRWTIQTALEEAVPAEVLSAALFTRFRSRQEHTFAEKLLSAMRSKFGGHVEPGAKK
ncbi:MAG: decarboxylating 6-phosphogluconate dehydrogenase [Candidatus Sumerlaeaceae bacterium]|nr:decarboxylating 6-phosphogluconate dehydrogenase [Candidatus Sumerlaeaceae bacterium]